MGTRPPSSSASRPTGGGAAPQFRFLPSEVAAMEARLQQLSDGVAIPSDVVLQTLADSFSASPDRAGKVVISPRQVWKWFQNRRYSLPPKIIRAAAAARHGGSSTFSSGRKPPQRLQLEFEAKSARDGAWDDVDAFLSCRLLESGDLEVLVRFSGFRVEDDEWINVRKSVRQRSLPCGATECFVVAPGDLILCFQERKEHALYFDAHVLDIQRRRHDARGCRCRFLVRYDHDSSEEIVPLGKLCRRPETDYRLQLHAARVAATTDVRTPRKEVIVELTSNDKSPAKQKPEKQDKMMDVNTDVVTMVSSLQLEGMTPVKAVAPLLSATSEARNSSSDATTK